jgi:hypothetical protein
MSDILKPSAKLVIPDPSAIKMLTDATHKMESGANTMSGVLARFEFDVTDEHGNVISKQAGPSYSFLRNFGRFMRQIFLCVSNTNDQVTDTTGQARFISVMDSGTGNEAPIAAPGQFRFGSSSAAVASDQFDVQTFLAGAQTTTVSISNVIETGSQLQFQVDGSIQNTSGGNWAVTEMVLCANVHDGSTIGVSRQVAMLRDIFSVVNVPNLSTANGHYIINIPV